MNELLIEAAAQDIVINPADLAAEVAQNVRMILTTPVGTLPLDRRFGLDFSILDQPMERAKALLAVEIFQKLKRYEPRAELVRVRFSGDGPDGTLTPNVIVRLKDE